MAQVTETTLREQLAHVHRMMVFADLLDYSGHVSARIPGTKRVLILPRDASRAGVKPDDMVVVDFTGKVIEGKGPAPTETAIHLGVYIARDDVEVVAHGHPPLSVLYSMVDRPVIAMRNYGFRFANMPIHPDPTHIRTLEQGADMAKSMGKSKYLLLRGHGNVVGVNSVPEVFLDCLEMEENTKAAINAAALGPLKPITAEETELLKVSFAKNDYRVLKVWEHYQEKARAAGAI
jgi:L-ribulose-5-phosphate 4-epimerase